MRFLIQIPQLVFGGAEKVLVNFVNELVMRDHEVEILESYEKGFLKSQFVSKVRFSAICSKEYEQKYYASLSDIKKEKNILKILQKCGKQIFSKIVGYRRFAEYLASKHYKNQYYDVAINYLEIESPKFLLNSVRAKKYFQWYHTDVSNISNHERTDKLIPLFERMDAIICVAESAKKSFVERYPNLKEKVYTMKEYAGYDKKDMDIKDPWEYGIEVYRKCAKEIEDCIDKMSVWT